MKWKVHSEIKPVRKNQKRKNKKEPTGEINPNTGKKIYKEVPDKYEYWLRKFIVKDDLEEEE